MKVSEYIGFVAEEGDRFAAAADHGSLDVNIASCPDWDMRSLVRHLGMIHLWAAANISFPEDDWLDVDELPDLVRYWPELTGPRGDYPADDDLVAWYRSTLANLVTVLSDAPADTEAFTFLPAPSPLSMWARRQASEIAIHRFDAEEARGVSSHFASHFAADMLDELLVGFVARPYKIDIEHARSVAVHTTDTDEQWHVVIGPELTSTERTNSEAELNLAGSAADLYLLLWNRTPGPSIEMRGDRSLIDLWRENIRVRWS